MGLLEEIEDLQGDLVLQQVMLSSIEGEAADEFEDERKQRREEIAEIKKKLAKLKHRRDTMVERNDSEGNIRDASAPPTAQPSPVQDQQHSSAAGPSYMSSRSITPSGDGFAESSQAASQSRKRNFDSASLGASNSESKSRRGTPVRNIGNLDEDMPWSSNHASSRFIDFIDLTEDGDDDGIPAEFLAQQRRAEDMAKRHHEQQESDRALALRLSQSSEQPSTSQPMSAPSSQPDAFNRIMTAQRLNSQQTPSSDSLQPFPDEFAHATPQPNYGMPGSYDTGWDQPVTGFPSAVNAGSPYQRHTSSTEANASVGGTLRNAPSSAYAMSPGEISTVFSIGTLPASSRQGEPSSGGQLQPAARNGFNPLSEIIDRTNGYDFVNGIDRFGRAIPAEIHDYVNHVVHDSKLDEKEIDDLLANIRPDMAIPAANRDGTPEGLKATLYHHQEIALTWMKSMEEGTNKGGILADDMGLGKTITMLALMLSRPARSRPKTNLIIGPLSLLKQWEEEILSKVRRTHKLSVFIYHGSKKNNLSTDDLLKFDVVLTTYMTLAAQNKRLEAMYKDAQETGRQIDFSDKAVISRLPLLHPKAKFHRIILDEAQAIKNVKTQSAQAVHRLKATYRWCLSGTPMMNSVEELFSLIHFLRIKPYNNWNHFKSHFGTLFGKGGEYTQTKAMNRLRTVLKAIMLRRKKDSTIDGRPILRLPPKTEQVVTIELSPDERSFYKTLENKSQVIFNKYLREGSVGKHYANVLVLLLRLRQACCHPHLNLDVEDRIVNSGEEMLRMVKELDSSIVSRIKGMDVFECPICYDPVQSPCFFIPCGHDCCGSCLASLVDTTLAQSIQAGNGDSGSASAICPVCRGSFDPTKCFTLEAFQKVHDPEKVKQEPTESEADEGGDDDGSLTSSSSSDWYESDDDEVDNKGNLKDFIVDDDFKSDSSESGGKDEDEVDRFVKSENDSKEFITSENDSKQLVKSEGDTKQLVKSEDEGSSEAVETKERQIKSKKAKRRSKGKGKAKAEDITADVKPSMLKSLRQDAVKNRAAYKKYMAYLRKTWLPSAKTSECLNLLKSIHETGEKTIVFSQWTLLLDLIEVGMRHEGFEHPPVRYDGAMSAKERNESATKFRTSSSANVILVSLKAGNAGLNLAAASRVIILDPFWNPYIEMQAVDRAYRIGQTREVQVYRILSQETVEDRIIALQDKKKSMIESAMDENEGRKISRLTVGELKFLFNVD